MVDSSGNSVASYTYDPYGKVLTATGALAEKNPLRYRGYYYDSESGLYYLLSRYYDPAVRRFINADSQIGIGNIGGYNLFSYCENDPVFQIDHSGEDGKTIELGQGWYCRIDGEDTNSSTQRHIHIWNKHNGTTYSQNDDGGPHDKGHNEKGKLPKWLQKQIESKTGWDYNGKRKSFLSRQAMNVGQKVYNTCSLMGLLLLSLLTSWQGFGTRSTHMRHFIFKAINLRIPTAEHTVTKCCIGQFWY